MAITAPPTKSLANSQSIAPPNQLSSTSAGPLVLWHLLSLDAPTVAALWTWFLARASHVVIPATAVLAMAVAVWMLYAADRLLDTRLVQPHQELEHRHYFHRTHRRGFVVGILIAALVLAALLPRLSLESLHLYLILGAMLFAYFILIHSATNSRPGRRLPKELAVGVFFSAATFIPTISGQPGLRASLLPAALLLAILCSLNCLFIYAWEHPTSSPRTHPATQAALRFLPALASAAIVAGIALAAICPLSNWQVPAACALSATSLLVLDKNRRGVDRSTLRAAADLCLLTPILLVPFLNR